MTEKEPTNVNTDTVDDMRKTFAREAGISEAQLKVLETHLPKRETRQKRELISSEQNFKAQCPSHETKPELNKSPVASISRQQTPSTPTTPKKDLRATNQTTPKTLRTPESRYSKKENVSTSIPKSVDEFYQNYITFCTKLFHSSESELHFIETYKQQMFELFETVISNGGIVKIISEGNKNTFFQQFIERFNVQTPDQIFRIYKLYLLHFQYHILQNYVFKQYHSAVQLFEEAVFVQEQDLRKFLDETPLDPKYFEYDIMVFKNGQNAIGIDSAKIHLDRVAEHYKNYSIDIRIQKAMDYGFKPRTMRNQPYQMKIGNYRIYQKLCEEYALSQTKIDKEFIERLGSVKDLDVNGTTFKERVNSQEIFFGVNFDPDGIFFLTVDGLLFDYINERVDGTFLGYKQQFDLLSYLDQEVPGCSFPQFYFKVKGVWTGGHQENINMCSVNINHGPDASEWYSMEFKYVEEFRAQLKKEYKMDLYGSQGLWYEKINWFMEQGKYPIKKIIQKKGDIVVSGPGTLHWVRSHGIALQSAWNQFPITHRMMDFAFWRQEQNERIGFIRSNTIPLKMLTVKLLNHQPPQLTQQIRQLCLSKLKMWYQREQDLFNDLLNEQLEFGQQQPRYEKLQDLQGFCTKCRQEILIYFISGKNVENVLCLSCFKKQYKNKKKSKRVYIRNAVFDLEQLIRRTASGKPFKEIRAFCGQYVGRVPVKCHQNKYKIDKQSIFIQKINDMNQELNKCDKKKMKQFLKKMKSKRISIQEEVKEQDKHEQPKSQQNVQIETEKTVQQCKEIKKIQIEKPKSKYQDGKTINGVKYIGLRRTPTGWWNFDIPENLKIITEQNHSDILKLIEQQQYHVKKKAREEGRRKQFPYNIKRNIPQSENYGFKSQWKNYENHQFCDDPKFSDDEDAQTDTIKKKIHKNQDCHDDKHGESKKQKQSPKHKKSHSRSKSSQKSKKRHKKSRSKSPKSSKKQHKNQSKHRSSSSHRRSNSRGKSSKRQNSRIEEEKPSRNRERQDSSRENHRNDDQRSQRNDYKREYNRDSNRNYNEQRNERNYRNNNQDSDMRGKYDNRQSRNQRNYDDRRNFDRNHFNNQPRNNWNQRSQNDSYQKRDNRYDRDQGSRYQDQGSRYQDQGSRYQGREDRWNNNDRRQNNEYGRQRLTNDERTQNDRKQYSSSQNNNNSGVNVKISQQNEQNDFDY